MNRRGFLVLGTAAAVLLPALPAAAVEAGEYTTLFIGYPMATGCKIFIGPFAGLVSAEAAEAARIIIDDQKDAA